MSWVKLPPLTGGRTFGCATCGYKPEVASLDMKIAVGFGDAYLSKNGKVVWSEDCKDWKDCITVAQAEEIAKKDPNNDWKIVLYGALSEAVYQRQGDSLWVLVKVGQGFA